MTDRDPHYGFAQRLRLALRWNASWSMLRAEGRDALFDVVDGAGNTALFVWALVRLLTLPVGVFVVSPIYTALLGTNARCMEAWREMDRILERERGRG